LSKQSARYPFHDLLRSAKILKFFWLGHVPIGQHWEETTNEGKLDKMDTYPVVVPWAPVS